MHSMKQNVYYVLVVLSLHSNEGSNGKCKNAGEQQQQQGTNDLLQHFS